MNQVNYQENYVQQSFLELIKTLGSNQQQNEITLGEETGAGSIRYIDIEAGLQLRMWDCMFFNGLEIVRQPKNDGKEKTFTVVYYLTPESFVLEDCQNSPAVINNIWNTVIMSSDSLFKARILPGKSMKCVSLNFSIEWLKKNLLYNTPCQNNLIQRFISSNNDPFVVFESLSIVERTEVEGFLSFNDSRNLSRFYLRSKSLNLLTELFSKVLNRLTIQNTAGLNYGDQMAEIEKNLVENIYNGLPDIKTLAKKIAVSESTLKRYFRRIYGKNIYSYFLEKRMDCAKNLLIEKRKSVTETAYIMGYENVSHFSNTFKRFFGVLPGVFLKTNTTVHN